jgi:drug/metabolite transporter (DMT)-like permease
MTNDALRPYLWMLLGSFAFSWMGTLAHDVGQTMDWQVVAMFRSAIPLVLVGAWALAGGVKLVLWKPPILWMRSIAGSVSLVGTFFALTRLPISDVFTVTNMFPVWVALLSWPLLGVFPGGKVWLSVACGVAGVVLIGLQGERPHGDYAIYIALSVSLFTALAMIGLHRLKELDTRVVVVHFSAVSLLFATVALFVFPQQREWHELAWSEIGGLAGVGLTATLGQIFLTKAFTVGDPAKISVVGLSQIVFSLALDFFVLHHDVGLHKLLGIPLIIGPTAWLLLQHHSPVKTEGYSDEPLETTPNIAE